MSGTPRFKLYDPQGLYVAAFKFPEDAAALLGVYGAGSKLRDRWSGSRVVWREGEELTGAADSYDTVAQIVWQRVDSYQQAAYRKIHGEAALQAALGRHKAAQVAGGSE